MPRVAGQPLVTLSESVASTRTLLDALGPLRMARLLAAMAKRAAWGEPYGHLPDARDHDEHLSREQARLAILLYKSLRTLLGQQEALRLTETIVIEAAESFLQRMIGPLQRDQIAAMNDDQLQSFARSIGDKFFNATMRFRHIDAELGVDFTVEACHFPPLCHACDAPELAPLFCKGDATFFGQVQPEVLLERPSTIAGGDATCHFILHWRQL